MLQTHASCRWSQKVHLFQNRKSACLGQTFTSCVVLGLDADKETAWRPKVSAEEPSECRCSFGSNSG